MYGQNVSQLSHMTKMCHIFKTWMLITAGCQDPI